MQKFSSLLSQKSKTKKLTKDEVEIEWKHYLHNIAEQQNYLPSTMDLFKIDYNVANEPTPQHNYNGIELEQCMEQL